MKFSTVLAIALVAGFRANVAHAGDPPVKRPNIIFILADDLGYGELGCYGQAKIKTPNLDRLAKEGMRFTQFYAGSTVCAPSRCVLMTGKHTGHCTIRGNARVPLGEGETTVARFLKSMGYVTALIGKWGLGEAGSVGVPTKQGFDEFFGFLNQHHAHNSYPDYLYRGEDKIAIAGNVVPKDNVASVKGVHVQELFTKEALAFVERNKSRPFFLYWALTAPHANNERGKAEGDGIEVPSDAPYSAEKWPQTMKNHAALISYMDAEIGKLLTKLRELGLEDDTIVIFTSDNGPHREGGGNPDFFRSSGPLRGIKRSLHDGGVRVPCIVRWPGHTKPGSTSDHVAAFQDLLPTCAELLNVKAPDQLDGISFLPILRGQPEMQKRHAFLYWEFSEGGFQQAVRHENWKAIRPHIGSKLALYDLATDIGEATDIASRHPDVVARIEDYLRTARTDSPHFPAVKGKSKKQER